LAGISPPQILFGSAVGRFVRVAAALRDGLPSSRNAIRAKFLRLAWINKWFRIASVVVARSMNCNSCRPQALRSTFGSTRLTEQVEQAVGLKWIRAFDFVWQGARLKGRAYRMFRST
jgi:hypothetical protein